MQTILHKNDLSDDIKFSDIIAADCEMMGLQPKRDPLCLIQLSEIGKNTSREVISKMLTDRLSEVNNDLVNYKKISTLIIVKDEWTQQNGIVGPTQKLKRGAIEDKYSKDYLNWHNFNEEVIFE